VLLIQIVCVLALGGFDAGAGATRASHTVGSLRADLSGDGRVRISWRSDVPTTGRVSYGRKGEATADGWALSDVPATQHAVELAGLAPDTGYLFALESFPADGGPAVEAVGRFRTAAFAEESGYRLSGRLEPWHPITLSFDGPFASELDDAPNPFLDYRLTVVLTSPQGVSLAVPGFFDGDGQGGGMGRTWRVRFPVHQAGRWTFVARFVEGPDVAVRRPAEPGGSGTPTAFDGTRGTFFVAPASADAEGFYARGKLRYVGEHYLRFADGSWFVKAGSNSPENLLGFAGFDNTSDQGGLDVTGLVNGLHRYDAHRTDFGAAGLGSAQDPLFTSADTSIDSRGLIGALDYLASMHVNSLFFLPMNLGGDGWETCPFVGYAPNAFDKTHYDVSKLAQWNEVFEHASRKGILLQFVLGETEAENEAWLDGGALGAQRKLFYREMIARFGHLPAIHWNLGEESDFSPETLRTFADWVQAIDPYDHPIGFHSNVLPVDGSYPQWTSVLGDELFATNSIQAIPWTAGGTVEKWRSDSAAAGHKWVVGFDEQTQGLTDSNAAELRKLMLWDVLFSGGGVEWYAGYHPLPLGGDLRMEDFRRREEMWRYTWNARRFLEQHLPFWVMQPSDNLVDGESSAYGGAEVFALAGYVYAVYYPEASSTGTLDLSAVKGLFRLRWYDPRAGTFVGAEWMASGRRLVTVGPPPSEPGEDWVLLVRR